MIKTEERKATNEFEYDRLSEFAPLSSEIKPTGNFFSRLLGRNKNYGNGAKSNAPTSASLQKTLRVPDEIPPFKENESSISESTSSSRNQSLTSDEIASLARPLYTSSANASPLMGRQSHRLVGNTRKLSDNSNLSMSEKSMASNVNDDHQSRTLFSVLRRLNSILDRKGSQSYRDSDFKLYWMPDDTCNECYECGDKFTTFRRRHHCRICGQIFCSRCCNREVPGRIFGYRGDLRVCTYCCRVVLSYAQQTDANGDLRSLREDLRSLASDECESSGTYQEFVRWTPSRRKTLFIAEEDQCRPRSNSLPDTSFGGLPVRNPFDITPQTEYRSNETISHERKVLTQDSMQLRELWLRMQSPDDGVPMTSHRLRLRTYHNCFTGQDMVDWLINKDKISRRDQGCAIGQALLDAKLIENISGMEIFKDEYALYRAGSASGTLIADNSHLLSESMSIDYDAEPMWTKEIKHVDYTTDDEEFSSLPYSAAVSARSNTLESGFTSHIHQDVGADVRRLLSDFTVGMRDCMTPQDSTDLSSASCKGSHEDLLAVAMVGKEETSVQEEERNWWQAVHSDQMHTDSIDKLAYDSLRKSHYEHLSALVDQLLVKENVSSQWAELILQLACHASEVVQPDVKTDNDDMDIRRYIQIKKIPGGLQKHSHIIHGAVFTKNVVHKKMRQNIVSPKIMLLKSSIVFQRIENKFSSIEPQILQEKEYLRNCISKVAALNPDVLLVEKTVSKLAKDFILEAGISLIVNVKPSVMERIARFTQADIIQSIDGLVSRPRLGLCHTFKVQTFKLPNDVYKSLVFFEGCATHLGCTIILRGAERHELAKVKSILNLIIYAAYHSRLEISYIMDENGKPPSQSDVCQDDAFMDDESSVFLISEDKETDKSSAEPRPSPEPSAQPLTTDVHNLLVSGSQEYTIVIADSDMIARQRLRSLEMAAIEDYDSAEGNIEKFEQAEPPLVYQPARQEASNGDGTPIAKVIDSAMQFKQQLDNTILTVSPYIQLQLPHLLNEAGGQSLLRQYFPGELYRFASLINESILNADSQIIDKPIRVELVDPHPFIVKPLVGSIFDSQNQNLMADYRARGGQVRIISRNNRPDKRKLFFDSLSASYSAENVQCEDESCTNRSIDSLDIHKHQRIAVLFSSYSYQSNNAPNPCINPWVVTMQYYGANDMTVGNFLERLCFRESYTCPNELCDTPMIDHIRKFVHENGCVAVVLRKLDPTALSSNTSIVMWNWCRKCKKITPPVPISNETWSMSFAKYLELRFHGSRYQRRSSCDPPCPHSLHHEHYQYFGYKHTVAALKYMNIKLREIALPPLEIKIDDGCYLGYDVLEDTKQLAVSGYSIYSKVLEYLCSLGQESSDQQDQAPKSYHCELEADRLKFRRQIENLQKLVTSRHLVQEDGTSLHSAHFADDQLDESSEEEDVSRVLCAIADEIVNIKRTIAQTVFTWNTKIQDILQLQKKNRMKLARESTPPDGLSVALESIEGSLRFDTKSRISSLSASLSKASIQSSEAATVAQDISNEEQSVFDTDHSLDTLDDASEIDTENYQNRPKFFIELDTATTEASFDTPPFGKDAVDGLSILEDECAIEEALHEKVVVDAANSITSTASYISETESGRRSVFEQCDSARHTSVNEEIRISTEENRLEKNSNDAISDTSDTRSFSQSNIDNSVTVGNSNNNEIVTRRQASTESRKSRVTSTDEKGEKKTMKQFLSNFLSGTPDVLLTSPFPAEEHHLLPACRAVPIVVYDKEPSSIIAYGLSSPAYEKLREMLKQQRLAMESNNSPQLRRYALGLSTDFEGSDRAGRKRKAVLSFFRSAASRDRSPGKAADVGSVHYIPDHGLEADSLDIDDDLKDETDFAFYSNTETEKNKEPHQHIELQFCDATAKFYCRVYYAQQFRMLRKLIFPAGEDSFIRSLARCAPWRARGGKSGSYFCKTLDDRFVLKQMSRLEMQSFLEFAPHYFQYITQTHTDQRPTVLAKIVGVYRIIFRNTQTNTATKQDLLVIENVFYGRKVLKRFDLKGSMRNRLVNTQGKREEELVLLDENLLQLIVDNPLYIRPHSKTVLTLAITHDTQFLSSHLIMDYSLLVGIDDNKKELVLGIIDYMRTFTWDKKLEMVVKASGILGGQGKMPTVISPELYRTRFLEAMDSYFPIVPDRWSGLGQNVDC